MNELQAEAKKINDQYEFDKKTLNDFYSLDSSQIESLRWIYSMFEDLHMHHYRGDHKDDQNPDRPLKRIHSKYKKKRKEFDKLLSKIDELVSDHRWSKKETIIELVQKEKKGLDTYEADELLRGQSIGGRKKFLFTFATNLLDEHNMAKTTIQKVLKEIFNISERFTLAKCKISKSRNPHFPY